MGVVKNLMVRAGADFSAITTQANKAKASMGGMQSSISRSCAKMTASVRGMGKIFAAIGVSISAAAITAFAKDAKAAYDVQAEGEAKLAQVMRNTIGASQEEIQAIKDLTAAQQALGVIGDEVQLAGLQELATYVTMSSTLETLLPTLNDMVAQQYGLAASAESAASIATMLGKVLSGQTSALSRYGYTFTAAQEAVLKYGTEAQRAAVLAEVVGESVGGMNAALAATPSGRLQQVSNTLGDIKENFGLAVTSISTTFLPALNGVCTVLADMATLANKVAQSIANVFGGGASAAAAAVTYTAGASSAMDGLTDSTEAAGDAAKQLGSFGFDTLQKMSGSTAAGAGDDAGADVNLGGGVIGGAAEGADEAAETVGWLEKGLARLKSTVEGIHFSKLTKALGDLKTAVQPLNSTLFGGLQWAYDNVLEPLAGWTIEDAVPAFLDTLAESASALDPALRRLGSAVAPLVSTAFEGLRWAYYNVFIPFAGWTGGQLAPAFLDALAAAAGVLSAGLSVLQPLGSWLWGNFLQPISGWTGGVIVTVLGDIASLLEKLASVISGNTSLGDFLSDLSFGETILLSFAVAVGTVNLAVTAWNVISGIATATTTGLGVAISVLTSPITLVTLAIAGLVAGIILLVQNWDTVKAAGAAAWANIQEVWSVAGAWFSTNIAEPVSTAWLTAMSSVREWGSNAWTTVQNAWSSAGAWFSTNVTTPISNGFKNFVNGVIGFFESMANGVIGGINFIIAGFNKLSFDVPDWVPGIGGETWGFNISPVATVSLPRLANGAVFKGGHPFAAIVNDQTRGTNVETPLSTMIEAMMTALEATGFGSDIQVNVRAIFDGQLAALARLLRPYFEADAQRVGQQASTAKGVL